MQALLKDRCQVSSRLQFAAVILVVSGCLPYLALKTAWISGSSVGIPASSMLHSEHFADLLVGVNFVTLLMDAAVLALVLVLTRPWGRQFPAWIILVPTWTATGLLGPILVAFPVQKAADVIGTTQTQASAAMLEPWVFDTVYAGFGLQAVGLGALFMAYSFRRWPHVRARGFERASHAPASTLRNNVYAYCAAITPAVPLALQTMWAVLAATGTGPAYLTQLGRNDVLGHAAMALFASAALVGAVLLVHRPHQVPAVLPLVLAWSGSGSLATWGAWRLLALLIPSASGPPSAMEVGLFAAQLVAGLLSGYLLAQAVGERARQATVSDVEGLAAGIDPHLQPSRDQ